MTSAKAAMSIAHCTPLFLAKRYRPSFSDCFDALGLFFFKRGGRNEKEEGEGKHATWCYEEGDDSYENCARLGCSSREP